MIMVSNLPLEKEGLKVTQSNSLAVIMKKKRLEMFSMMKPKMKKKKTKKRDKKRQNHQSLKMDNVMIKK